jgi:hypothetical protein
LVVVVQAQVVRVWVLHLTVVVVNTMVRISHMEWTEREVVAAVPRTVLITKEATAAPALS